MRVALFGGSFDPPHLGHQQVVQAVIDQHLFDQVWYVPVGNHDFGKQLALAADRVAMLELIAQPHTRIETYELEHPGTSYTHQTITALQETYPEHEFSWIIGSDQLASLYKWGCALETACFPDLLEQTLFYVYPRTGYAMELPYSQLKPLTQVDQTGISSTEIRARTKAGQSIAGLVDPQVAQYIKTHPDLYRS